MLELYVNCLFIAIYKNLMGSGLSLYIKIDVKNHHTSIVQRFHLGKWTLQYPIWSGHQIYFNKIII
ncbi:hypothetical protein IQ37_11210 [Chryseobacterium piperi]|uniref:Uncharacterized protein n=1 Tax=Chryseobacterium piperi TaxID=558152 RepID=A0A086BCS4_9FLAO|nr:hypothetical protein IQ37_11210 [Chryseobacterium piperi]